MSGVESSAVASHEEVGSIVAGPSFTGETVATESLGLSFESLFKILLSLELSGFFTIAPSWSKMEAASAVKSSAFFVFPFVVFSFVSSALFVCSLRALVLELEGELESSDTTRSTIAGELLVLASDVEVDVDGGGGGGDGL